MTVHKLSAWCRKKFCRTYISRADPIQEEPEKGVRSPSAVAIEVVIPGLYHEQAEQWAEEILGLVHAEEAEAEADLEQEAWSHAQDMARPTTP